MKKLTSFFAPLIVSFFITFYSIDGKAQTLFTSAPTGGNWNDGATWGNTSPGVQGTDWPANTDDVYITGGATVTVNSFTLQCRNLLVDVNSANVISIGAHPMFSLTVNGTMAGWDNNFSFVWPPGAFGSSITGNGGLIFTGSNIGGLSGITNEMIAWWNNVNQINVNVTFNNSSGSAKYIDQIYTSGFAATFIRFLQNVTVDGGIVQTGTTNITGLELSGAGAILKVSSGATLSLFVPVTSDGTNSINQLDLDGTVTTSSYINSTTFDIASTGTLNTSYLGTQGWWSGSNIPSSFSIDDASTINYGASAAQNVYARQYGNLEMSNSGTKTLSGAGTLVVTGDLNISSGVTFDSQSNTIDIHGNLINTGSWSPTQSISFTGTGTQVISGTGTSFLGGMVLGDGSSTTTVELSEALTTPNIEIKNNSTFDPKNNNIILSGDWANNGTYTTGSESITFNGTTDISGSSTTTFHDIIISGILNGNSSVINVSGSFTNNSTFNRATSTIVFNGSSEQLIAGTASTSFHNLTISNTASDLVKFNSDVDLYNVLTLNANSHIDTDDTGTGTLTLISNSSGTAKIGALGDQATFDGNITMQRRVAEGTTGWRYISTPVQNQTLSDWSDDFSIQGVATGGAKIVFTYDETAGTSGGNGLDGWIPFTTISDNISGSGIKAYFYDSQIAGDLILDNTGPPVIGNGGDNTLNGTEKYQIDLDYTTDGFDGGGWNLVENPYPCEIDYESVISATGKDAGLVNVDNGIYIWNPTVGQSGNYGSYVGTVSINSVTRYIASGQSFFVKANATGGSISYIEEDKVTDQGNSFVREAAVENVLKIQVESTDKINFDETAIRFKKGSSENFEHDVDAYKLANGWINISTLPQEDLDLSINTLDEIRGVKSIKIRLAAYKSKEFKLSFSGFESFTSNYDFRLIDKYLNKTTLIDAETEYVFQVLTGTPETFGDERFELLFTAPVNFRFDQVWTKAGQEFVMPVYVDQFADILSAQLAIGWDESELTFVGMEDEGVIDINDFDKSKVKIGSLSLTTVYATPTELPDDTKLFSIRFLANSDTESALLSFDRSLMNVNAIDDVDMPFNTEDVAINFKQNKLLGGNMLTFSGEPVDNVKVQVIGDDNLDHMTDISGLYALNTFGHSDYTISASKTDDAKLNEAVTMVDIIKTRRHILDKEEFASPYQIVAADVNDSKTVTARDIVQMRKVILGIKEGFSSGLNWLFIPDTYDLSLDPFSFETSLDISLFDQDMNLDFVAVKIGDVNNSWTNQSAGRSSKGKIELSLEYVELKDEFITIPVIVSDFNQISGYQFSLTWDANHLEYQGIEYMALEGHFNEQYIGDGILTTLWEDERNGQSIELEKGTVLFKLKFKPRDDTANSLVSLNSTLTQAVAFDSQFNAMDIKSVSANVNLEELRNGRMELYQNVPNPLEQTTEIGFRIVKEGLAKLSIINLLGETVYSHKQHYNAGVHVISWESSQGSRPIPPGVYLYRLESNGQELIKKMLIK